MRPCVLGASIVAVLALGCGGKFVAEKGYPDLASAAPIERVAVVPLRLAGRLATREAAISRALEEEPSHEGGNVAPAPEVVAELIAHYLAEALSARGTTVVPASDVAHLLGDQSLSARATAARLHAEFGVDGILYGRVSRFVERSGEAIATLRPASVRFEVTLHSAPGGAPLWTGDFDETQKPINENVLRAARYPGAGARWLTAEELARWGAGEVVRVMPLAAPAP